MAKKKRKNKKKHNHQPLKTQIKTKKDVQYSHSRIQREIPNSIIEIMNDMLDTGNATYEEVQSFLSGETVILKDIEYKLPDDGKTYDISRSSIGRYGKRFFDIHKDFRFMQQQAKMMVNESDDALFMEEAVSRLSISKLFKLLMENDLQAHQISTILTSISRMQSAAVIREKFKQTMTKKIKKAIKSKGLSDEAVDELESFLNGD